MNYLEEISIKGGVFFKDFAWKDIPKLAVISGVNGSGKTLLLKAIDPSSRSNMPSDERIGIVTKPDILTGVFFVPFDSVKNNEIPNIDTTFINGVDARAIDHLKEGIIQNIKHSKINAPDNPRYSIEKYCPSYEEFYDKKNHNNKELWEASDERVHNFAYKTYPLTKIKNLGLATIFLYFKQKENEFKTDLFNSTDSDKKLKEKLESFIQINP
jgi:AAA15 family ATPase/GTPase